MNQEVKKCQNCKKEFTIESEDFDFYKKMNVPAPTFCPECRFQRRLIFRNERVFYKRKCDLCGKSVVSIFSPDKPYTVYCQPCWWSDKWDSDDYAMEYDSGRNFFEQVKEVQRKVPHMSLVTGYSTLVNSEYVNHAGYAKNCYLIFNSDHCENVLYGTTVNYDKDSMDALILDESELCYQVINCRKCYRTFFSEDCSGCSDVYFSKSLIGCNNCFGCVNLRNKNYHIFNKPYPKEEYEEKLKALKLDSHTFLIEEKKKTHTFWEKFPRKFIHGFHNVNVSGDYVYECKNAHYMYQTRFVEDGKFCQFMTLKPAKDIYDLSEWGNGVQRVCDSITVGEGADTIRFCFGTWDTALENEYSMFAVSSSNVFGCVCVKKKRYCILNKQYDKESFSRLRGKIIQDMNERPYVDSKGRVWKYGEFIPYDLSLFDYNETTAHQYYPLSKEQILEKGWRWHEPTPAEHKITLLSEKMPDSINDVTDSILQEVLECMDCKKAYRVVRSELDLLRRFEFPLPRKCPDCRHMERMSRVNPPRLWDRKCAKCGQEIKTGYAPEKKEIVYCEKCYQKEVI
ncbi:MAG: hypothetical protein KJI72_01005 [Patescibacteria group bacterium]|nr:hypothetical protein [Patescibacteria group bacterium]